MRVVNRPLAFILAAALGVAAVIVIIEVIAAASHHNPVVVPWTTWYRWANRTRWDQLVIQIWSAIIIAVGVVLLALELKRPRVTRLSLRSQHDATDAAMTRRGLAKTLRAAATGIDGISGGGGSPGAPPPPPPPRPRRPRREPRGRGAARAGHPDAAGAPGRHGPAPPAQSDR